MSCIFQFYSNLTFKEIDNIRNADKSSGAENIDSKNNNQNIFQDKKNGSFSYSL